MTILHMLSNFNLVSISVLAIILIVLILVIEYISIWFKLREIRIVCNSRLNDNFKITIIKDVLKN